MGGMEDTFSPLNWSVNLTQGAAMAASRLTMLRSDRKSAHQIAMTTSDVQGSATQRAPEAAHVRRGDVVAPAIITSGQHAQSPMTAVRMSLPSTSNTEAADGASEHEA